jgi:hypothetical protein
MRVRQKREMLRRIARAGFGLALRIHTPGFRRRFGGSMEETFEAILDRSDRVRSARAVTDLTAHVAGMLSEAMAERVRAFRFRPAFDRRGLLGDVRVAVRSLLARPRFALTAAGMLALGIGVLSG